MCRLSNKGGGRRERHSQHPFGNKYALNTTYFQNLISTLLYEVKLLPTHYYNNCSFIPES